MASVRKALAAEHAAIAAKPKDAANYIDLAYTLIDAGMGDQAIAAAAEATRVDPTNAIAFSAQGWVLHHNSIGVDYGRGFDYDGSLRAFRRSIELDPQDLEVRQSLANLLEFNRDGVRYAPDAQLALAIDAYRYVKQHQHILRADVIDNLAIDLFYAGRYDDAIHELSNLSGTLEHLGIILASTAALKGAPAAVEISHQIAGDEQRRKDALNFAAEGLWNKRLYHQAADLMTASLPDTTHGGTLPRKIQLFQSLQPFASVDLPLSDPRRPVQRLLEAVFLDAGGVKNGRALVSRYSYPTDAAVVTAADRMDVLEGVLFTLMKQTGLPRSVIADILLGRMVVNVHAASDRGASVRVQVMGLAPIQYYVVREDDTWKVAAAGESKAAVAAQTFHLVQSERAADARLLLDWYYSLQQPAGSVDDPLSGNLFAGLWTPSVRTFESAPLLASAALTSDPALLRQVVPVLTKERDSASAAYRRNLDLLLANVYLGLGDGQAAQAVTSGLLKDYPDSNTALHLAGRAYALQHDWAAWKAVVAERLQKEPESRQLLLENVAEAEAEGDIASARRAYAAIVSGTHGTAVDHSAYAWLSLYQGTPDEPALAAAQQATTDADVHNYQSLLTLACLDAARGKSAAAHQELLDAMAVAHLAEPDAAIWFGFGLIFEQYGVLDAAATAYRRTVQMAPLGDSADFVPGQVGAAVLARKRLVGIAGK